jgi:hypothetical protein
MEHKYTFYKGCVLRLSKTFLGWKVKFTAPSYIEACKKALDAKGITY